MSAGDAKDILADISATSPLPASTEPGTPAAGGSSRIVKVCTAIHTSTYSYLQLFLSVQEPRKLKKLENVGGRRPSGMTREVYALLYTDNKDQ